MNHVKLILAAATLTICGANTLRGQAFAEDKNIIYTGSKLEARSRLIPYDSREAALAGKESASPYILALNDWASERSGDDINWSTKVKIPRSWYGRTSIFRIEGATSSFSVAVNGEEAGYSQSGIGRTEFDITKLLKEDYNDITVTVYGNAASRVIENQRPNDKLEFRHASVVSQPPVRVRDITLSATTDDNYGNLSFGIIMKSHLRNAKHYTVSYELLSPGGDVVAQSSRGLTTHWLGEDTLRFHVAVRDVKKWNHESPHLYTLVVNSNHEGRNMEYIPIKVGFRNIGFKKDGGLFVDGTEIPLTVREAAYAGGYAETEKLLRRMKDSGVNMVSAAGHPQPDAFYPICDRIGMYVCDLADINTSGQPRETTIGGNPSNDPGWAAAYIDRVSEMYRSSAYHPSVVIFAMAENSSNGFCLYESYMALRQLDPARPVIYRDSDGQWNDDNIVFNTDGQPLASGVSLNAADLAYGGTVRITNNNMLADIDGNACFTIRQGDRQVGQHTSRIHLAPGGGITIEIPRKLLAKAKSDRSVEVVVASEAIYDHAPKSSEAATPSLDKVKRTKNDANQYGTVIVRRTFGF